MRWLTKIAWKRRDQRRTQFPRPPASTAGARPPAPDCPLGGCRRFRNSIRAGSSSYALETGHLPDRCAGAVPTQHRLHRHQAARDGADLPHRQQGSGWGAALDGSSEAITCIPYRGVQVEQSGGRMGGPSTTDEEHALVKRLAAGKPRHIECRGAAKKPLRHELQSTSTSTRKGAQSEEGETGCRLRSASAPSGFFSGSPGRGRSCSRKKWVATGQWRKAPPSLSRLWCAADHQAAPRHPRLDRPAHPRRERRGYGAHCGLPARAHRPHAPPSAGAGRADGRLDHAVPRPSRSGRSC